MMEGSMVPCMVPWWKAAVVQGCIACGGNKQLQQKTGSTTNSKVIDLQAPTLETSPAGGQAHTVSAGPEVAEWQHWEACGGQCSVGEACQAVLHPA